MRPKKSQTVVVGPVMVERIRSDAAAVVVVLFLLVSSLLLSLETLSPAAAMVVTTTRSSTPPQQQRYGSALSHNKNCIIVGGGPIGLATALTLARAPHYYNVTVFEATADLTSTYNPSKSFLYNVNARGLDWFMNPSIAPPSAFEQLQQKGYSPGVGSMGNFFVVPADPSQSIPNSKRMNAISSSNNNKQHKKLPSTTPRPGYWIPRHQLNEILYDCCQEHNNDNSNGIEGIPSTRIQVCSGKVVCAIYPSINDTNVILVQCEDGSIDTASLLVAADGINSFVRTSLAGLQQLSDGGDASSHSKHSSVSSPSWLQSNTKSFRVKKFKSPATGLKFKALQFKPNMIIPNRTKTITTDHDAGKTNIPAQSQNFLPQSTDILSFRGVNTGFRNRLSLGFLPIKDPNMIRLGNTIAPYDHDIWSLPNGTAAQSWFTRTFPRMLWNDSLISDGEWDRYVQTRSTTFPYCQYSPGSAVASPNGLSGVVLVGDACHAFPPDTGQGVNSGLQDVVALDRALRNADLVCGDDESDSTVASQKVGTVRNLGTSLLAYQKNRGPEHAALIRLARFGGPYQYRQPWLRHRIGAMMWTMNFLFRTIMNKLSFGCIPSPIFILAADQSLSYRQVMMRADMTAFGFQFIFSTIVIRWMLLRWMSTSWKKIWMVGVSTEASAACLALILLKVFLPLKDQIESYMRREKLN